MAGTLLPKFLIDRFVAQSQPWIAKHLHRLHLRSSEKLIDWSQNHLTFLGKPYVLSLETQKFLAQRVSVEHGTIRVNPASLAAKHAKKTLEVWLKHTAEIHITRRVKQLSGTMQASYSKLRFSQQSTRWGSCSSTGTLSFNWRLIHFSPETIDYVVIHELAHTFEMNHSAAFWRIVRAYCPAYAKHKHILSRYNSHIE